MMWGKKKNERHQGAVVLGVSPTGERLIWDLDNPSHGVIQGMSRSGKSSATMSIIHQLVTQYPQVRVHMIDPTGVLGNPLAERFPDHFFSLGMDDDTAPGAVVDRLLALMQDRIDGLWDRKVDKVHDRADYPLDVLVIEEVMTAISWLSDSDAAEGRKSGERLAPRFLSGIRRLLAGSLKVNICLLLLSQKISHDILPTNDRNNIAMKLSLRVDSTGAQMLFPDITEEERERLVTAKTGTGILSTPLINRKRIATKWLDYSGYLQGVSGDGIP